MNGYYELIIGDNHIPMNYNLLALKYFSEKRNIAVESAGQEISLGGVLAIVDLMWCAHKAYCTLHDKPLMYGADVAVLWAEEINQKQLEECTDNLLKIKFLGKTFEEHSQDSEKKS